MNVCGTAYDNECVVDGMCVLWLQIEYYYFVAKIPTSQTNKQNTRHTEDLDIVPQWHDQSEWEGCVVSEVVSTGNVYECLESEVEQLEDNVTPELIREWRREKGEVREGGREGIKYKHRILCMCSVNGPWHVHSTLANFWRKCISCTRTWHCGKLETYIACTCTYTVYMTLW